MINFIHEFLSTLSDEELTYFRTAAYTEAERRDRGQTKELNEEEKQMIRDRRFVDAIKQYRARNSCTFMEAKIAVDRYRDTLTATDPYSPYVP